MDRAEAGPPLSELLDELRQTGDGERITLGEIFDETGGRAHGAVLVLLGLPETIPMIGLSAILATPIFVIGTMMMIHGADPPIPQWVRRRSIPRSHVESAVDRTQGLFRWFERITRPRWGALAGAGRVQGVTCMILAAVLAFPMPGINIVAAFGVVGIGLGILQRDGRIVAASLLAAAVATAGTIAVVTGGAALIRSLG